MKYNKIEVPDRIHPSLIISAFANEIQAEKLASLKGTGYMDFPPILGFPSYITKEEVGQDFLSGDTIKKKQVGKLAWYVTDGHHRSLYAIEAGLPFIFCELDRSTITDAQELREYDAWKLGWVKLSKEQAKASGMSCAKWWRGFQSLQGIEVRLDGLLANPKMYDMIPNHGQVRYHA